MAKKLQGEKNKLTVLEWVFLTVCFLFFVLWSLQSDVHANPDEAMRFDIPKYIFENGRLPNGNDPTLRNPLWGFSYAYYPQFFGPLVSTLFMAVSSLFSANAHVLLVAARMTSVLCGVGTIYFTMKLSRRILPHPFNWLMVVLVGMIPQFVYLSSYVNNDIVAVFASSIIFCAWVYGVQDGWNVKNAVMLGVGVSVCALSYYNAYGWILCSVIIFFASFYVEKGRTPDYRLMGRRAALIAGIALLVCGCFFIRNAVLYNGDFLGMKTLNASSEQYAVDFLKPSLRNTPQNLGSSVWDMLNTQGWVETSRDSFVGILGKMDIILPQFYYTYYTVIFWVGAAGAVGCILKRLVQKKWTRANTVWVLCMALCIVIPVALSIYYSYATDYQPQGRYVYPLLLALGLVVTKGIQFLANPLPPYVKRGAVFCLCATCVISTAVVYFEMF
ncbi:hypothetical protein LJB83_01835 [Clostridia bacterium OttesenSCG-928-F22]|nr:hypothetical protein [Clostridia bacterium OttesenSCG-928-F22]